MLGTVKNKPESLGGPQRNFPLPALVIGTGQQQALYGQMERKHASALRVTCDLPEFIHHVARQSD